MKILLLNVEVKSVPQLIYRPLVYRVKQYITGHTHTHTLLVDHLFTHADIQLYLKKDDRQLMLWDTITHPIRESFYPT